MHNYIIIIIIIIIIITDFVHLIVLFVLTNTDEIINYQGKL